MRMCIQRKGQRRQCCDVVLEALAPLGGVAMEDLRLQGWEINPTTVACLVRSFPGLGDLTLVDCSVSGEALQALGCTASIRGLHLHSKTWPAVLRKAL